MVSATSGNVKSTWLFKVFWLCLKLTERLSSSTVRRMDGLHNVKAMKQMLVGAEVIVNDLVEEGFDEMEVLAYLIEKIKKSAL